MKQFLYLVQSRIGLLENHTILESDNSDYLCATFEKKIDRENFIYVPNTIWTEGRNILYEEAMKRKDHYEYFVFLDDDIVFERGSFRVFENEVLHIQADFAMPVYLTHPFIQKYDRYNPFQYSTITFFDQAFICLSRELFCSPKLLPFDMAYVDRPDLGGGVIAPSNTFFMELYDHFSDKKLLVTNNVAVRNSLGESHYGIDGLEWYFYYRLRKHYKRNNPDYRDIIHKKVVGMMFRVQEDWLKNICEKIRSRVPRRLGINTLLKASTYTYLALLEKYIFIVSFIRDLKLNLRLRKAQQ